MKLEEAMRESVTSVTPLHWRKIDSQSLEGFDYRGEGNATLVIALPREKRVLRFRKSDPTNGDEAAERDGSRKVRLMATFFRKTISGLMGSYASEPEIVKCSEKDVERLMKLIEAERPAFRKHKKVVETFATTLPDYALLPEHLDAKIASSNIHPTFCVEIKPKQGFIEAKSSNSFNKCDYCLKQSEKLSQGKISVRSNYCPCDLFSGESEKMRRAVRGLIDSPQNNFRIFRNGRLVWAEGFHGNKLDKLLSEWFYKDNKTYKREEALNAFFQLISEALLRPFPQNFKDNNAEDDSPSNNKEITGFLPLNSVLETILRLQKIDYKSADYVFRLYSKYSNVLTDEMIYFQEINENTEENYNENKEEKKETTLKDEELVALRNYLLFRLAKDCSILSAFRKIDSENLNDVPSDNIIRISGSRYFLFNNAVTDLDPKSVHSIEKHRQRAARTTNEISKPPKEGQGKQPSLLT